MTEAGLFHILESMGHKAEFLKCDREAGRPDTEMLFKNTVSIEGKKIPRLLFQYLSDSNGSIKEITVASEFVVGGKSRRELVEIANSINKEKRYIKSYVSDRQGTEGVLVIRVDAGVSGNLSEDDFFRSCEMIEDVVWSIMDEKSKKSIVRQKKLLSQSKNAVSSS